MFLDIKCMLYYLILENKNLNKLHILVTQFFYLKNKL